MSEPVMPTEHAARLVRRLAGRQSDGHPLGDPHAAFDIYCTDGALQVGFWLAQLRQFPTEEQLVVLAQAESGAEALLAWQFAKQSGTRIDDGVFVNDRMRLVLQAPAKLYRIDLVAETERFKLAIEVDGYGFHHKTPEQVAADDLRQRRLVVFGYTVVRFGTREIMHDAAACWEQVESIMARRG